MEKDETREIPPDTPAGHENETVTIPSSASRPQENSSNLPPVFGHYERLEFLGEGGMARVYKAYDSKLHRTVALKFLRQENPELAQRLLMEARSQARIEHENVCKVHEAGELEGRPYISMQYIEGKTLKDLVNELTLEQKIKLMKEVALAVHAAHRVGIIHRDLKPSNVMVSRNEDGDLFSCVMDFGLARQVEAPGLTVTGVILGSPWYMSPEQAVGEVRRLDRRSDVYGLGCTLYEVLTDRLPFEGEHSIEVLMKVVHEDPVPLRQRDSAIPSDLETITMKCLEKEPERRFESARVFAEELQRYLDGEPILSLPTGWAYRVYKKARKNKAIFITSALAFLLILVFAGLALHSKWNAREQAILAQQFGQQVKEMEAILRVDSMMPLHDTRAEKNKVRARMLHIQQRMKEVGEPGYGPGLYALGRGHLALHEYEKARGELEKAWQSHYRTPEVAYALGLANGKLYQGKLEEMKRMSSPDLQGSRKKEIRKEYRDPALRYLKLGRGISTEAPEYVESLIALYDGRWKEAHAKADSALKSVPSLFDAWNLKGEAYFATGIEHEDHGDYDSASKNYILAVEAYESALQIARSSEEAYEGQCKLWTNLLRIEVDLGNALEPSFQKAIKSCDLALRTNPESFEALNSKAYAYWEIAYQELYSGKNPQQSVRFAIDSAQKSLKIHPQSPYALADICNAYLIQGGYEMDHGIDARKSFDLGIENCKHAASIYPNYAEAFNSMGIAYRQKGEYEKTHGIAPTGNLENAIRCYENAITISPWFSLPYNSLGNAWNSLGDYETWHGKDPRKAFEKAIENFRSAIAKNPKNPYAHNNMGAVYLNTASYERNHGLDPRPAIETAIENFRNAIHVNPKLAMAYNNTGQAFQQKAEYEMDMGLEPLPSLHQARKSLQEALHLNAQYLETPLLMVLVWIVQGRFELKENRSPEAALQQAEKYLDQAKQLNAGHYLASLHQGLLHLLRARWKMQSGLQPADWWLPSWQ